MLVRCSSFSAINAPIISIKLDCICNSCFCWQIKHSSKYQGFDCLWTSRCISNYASRAQFFMLVITGVNKIDISFGLCGPNRTTASKIFLSFILISGGILVTIRKTGQILCLDEANACTPSVFKIRPACSGDKRKFPGLI